MQEEVGVANFYWKGAELFLTLSCYLKTCTYVPSLYFWAKLKWWHYYWIGQHKITHFVSGVCMFLFPFLYILCLFLWFFRSVKVWLDVSVEAERDLVFTDCLTAVLHCDAEMVFFSPLCVFSLFVFVHDESWWYCFIQVSSLQKWVSDKFLSFVFFLFCFA